ncbi:NlpC/P60 family protein [Novosphingobium album (ex Hu et al. 2023)]|uniref:NlpC/P60 family protein n=1 Tax=Novosphingobium album (ex Hu et al. 2023) TaxID=2930093 RepID=A0ABT0B0Y5_9SPHN|nr:NlpC/P60 family protein [Novosphingobium album (ex Hu et al. 2023)]MCJ2178685.1 NlpC/P60 family protein [Novosphingobium album (ex Hu et al. 2023)]
MTGSGLALAARELVGVPFRLHGRDPRSGLDCIGVLEAACSACGITTRLPARYTLRSRRLPPLADIAARLGLFETHGQPEPGDVLFVQPGPCQQHLMIATGPCRFVHAHAGLRRVVEGPLPAGWAVSRHWRPLP